MTDVVEARAPRQQHTDAVDLPRLMLLCGAERRKDEADSENDREPDQPPHGAPRLRMAAGESSRTPLRAPASLLHHLIRPQQQRLRDCEAERPRGLEVADQLELGGLLARGARSSFCHALLTGRKPFCVFGKSEQ